MTNEARRLATITLPQNHEVVVLGAGISGLTTAYYLAAAGRRVLVLDNYARAGGNHRWMDAGGGTFDIGSIFFNEGDPQFSLFPGTMDVCVPVARTTSRVAPDSMVRKYPFSAGQELFSRSAAYVAAALASAAIGRMSLRVDRTAADYARRHMGQRIFEDSGLAKYIERLYSVPADEIDIAFANKRMDWIARHSKLLPIIRRLIFWLAQPLIRPRPSSKVCPKAYARPRAGFHIYYDKILDQLRASGVVFRFSAGIDRIVQSAGHLELHTRQGRIRTTRIINSIPLPILSHWLGLGSFLSLESNRLTTLCCSFRGRRGFSELMLYNFHPSGLWKRLTMHSDYYGRTGGREFFSVEITQLVACLPIDQMFHDFQSHVRSVGLFDGELRLEGHFSIDHAYPLYRLGTERRVQGVVEQLAKLGVESVGRQGCFNYIPSTRLAVELVRHAYATPPVSR